MRTFVLDASGLLAYLQDEEGAAEVTEALTSFGAISAVNLAEALSKLAESGADPAAALHELEQRRVLGGFLEIAPLTKADALAIAELRPSKREHGLGLGDRACLALGRRLQLPVLTTDRVWAELQEAVGVEVRVLR